MTQEEDPRRRLGRQGEAWVAAQLEARGYTIAARNRRIAGVEVDLIARRQRSIAIIEVKTCTAPTLPETQLRRPQIQRLQHAAQAMAWENGAQRQVSILLAAVQLRAGREPRLRFFRLSDFEAGLDE